MNRYLLKIRNLLHPGFILILSVLAVNLNAAFAQRMITGKITDSKTGESLPGVSVRQKGQNNGTMSDNNGFFRLRIIDEKAPVLVFTSIGFVVQEVPLQAQSVVNVKLVSEAKGLEEVVIVGYGSQKKESVVGAIGQTSGDLILKQSVPEVANALSGLIPGLVTSQSSGVPGGSSDRDQATKIFIRGRSTWNAAQPLVLVDGVERSIDDVDAYEIDKISILKDASATAVFGVKGANGVILITTKRGKEGKASLNADAEMMVNTLSRVPGVLNSYEGNVQKNAAVLNEVAINESSWAAYYKPQEILNYYRTQEYPELYPDVDWLDEYTRDFSTSKRLNLNAGGGTKFAKYFGSLSYLSQGDIIDTKDYGQGYTPSFSYKRFNFRSNLDFNITRLTKLSVNLAGMYGVQKSPNANATAYAYFWKALTGFPPDIYPVRYSDGTWGEYSGFDKYHNPIADVNFDGVKSDNRTQISTDLLLDQKLDFITKGFSLSGRISFDNYLRTDGADITDDGVVKKYIPPSVVGLPQDQWEQYAIYVYPTSASSNGYNYTDLPNVYSNETATTEGQRRATDYQLSLNYARSFGDHNVSGLFLVKRNERATGQDFLSKGEDWVGRATYNYKSKYLIEFNGAYNGSEKFDRKYRFGFFPSVALGWTISNEEFFKKLFPFAETFKVRYSNGKVGNDQGIARWQYVSNWNPLTKPWRFGSPFPAGTGIPITIEGTIANPNIHWETAHKQNLGLDAEFMKSTLTLAFDYFWDTNSDIFISAAQRTSNDIFGAPLPAANIGKTKIHGYEIDLGYRHNFNNNLAFNLRYTQSFAKDKIIERDDPLLSPDYQKQAGYQIGQIRTQINQPGIMQSWDDIYTGVLGLDNSQRLPGDFRQVDYNADGYVDGNDAVPYGYTNRPQYTNSLNIGVNFKGFNAGILFSGAWNVSLNNNYNEFQDQATIIRDFQADGAWNPEAGMTTSATYPGLRLVTSSPKGNYWIQDASYVRIKSAELGYTFNKNVLKKLNVSRLQIYLRGYNLALWSDVYEDREAEGGQRGIATRDDIYPLTRSFTIGMAVGF